jgi:hypothetical protein
MRGNTGARPNAKRAKMEAKREALISVFLHPAMKHFAAKVGGSSG